jgi:hypothetical protein
MKLSITFFILYVFNVLVYSYDYIPKDTENGYFMRYNKNNTREDIKVSDVIKNYQKNKNNYLK